MELYTRILKATRTLSHYATKDDGAMTLEILSDLAIAYGTALDAKAFPFACQDGHALGGMLAGIADSAACHYGETHDAWAQDVATALAVADRWDALYGNADI